MCITIKTIYRPCMHSHSHTDPCYYVFYGRPQACMMNDVTKAYEPSAHCLECLRFKSIAEAQKRAQGR